jgi:hypothetical protein
MAGWNGLTISVASRLLSSVGIEIVKNEEEGCIVAKHPTSEEVIRRTSVTACVETVLKEWMVLK